MKGFCRIQLITLDPFACMKWTYRNVKLDFIVARGEVCPTSVPTLAIAECTNDNRNSNYHRKKSSHPEIILQSSFSVTPNTGLKLHMLCLQKQHHSSRISCTPEESPTPYALSHCDPSSFCYECKMAEID